MRFLSSALAARVSGSVDRSWSWVWEPQVAPELAGEFSVASSRVVADSGDQAARFFLTEERRERTYFEVVPTFTGLIFHLVPSRRGVTFTTLKSPIVPTVAPPPFKRLTNSLKAPRPCECPKIC